ncbi:hypothetical protein Hanom_Chr12g01165111 [Helianthus anomalus]
MPFYSIQSLHSSMHFQINNSNITAYLNELDYHLLYLQTQIPLQTFTYNYIIYLRYKEIYNIRLEIMMLNSLFSMPLYAIQSLHSSMHLQIYTIQISRPGLQ